MPLTTYTKNSTNTTSLNNGAVWVGGVVPASSTDSRALWDTTTAGVIANGIGASTTWGQLQVTNTSGVCTIIGTASQIITLDPTNYSNVGIALTSAAATNFTLNALNALGSTQTWSVASGRTLTVSGVVSGAFSLTKSDTGTLAFTGANTFGGVGQSFTAAAGITTGSGVSSFGSASNSIFVSSGGSIAFLAVPVQTSFNMTGSGAAGGYGAIHAVLAGWAAKTLTFAANDTVLSVRNVAFAFTLATGSGVTNITLNGETTSTVNASAYTVTTASSYPASGNVTVTLKSFARDGSTARAVKYSIGSAAGVTDAVNSGGGGLGVNSNPVTVETTGGLLSASASGTFNRNYTFISRPIAAYTHFLATASPSTTTFAGTLTLSGADYVHFAGPNLKTAIIKFSGTVTGTANLTVGSAIGGGINIDCATEIASTSDFSGWTGNLSVNDIRYGLSLPNENAISFQDGNPSVISNVSGGDLTVRHSSYTPDPSAPTPNYTGPNNLTMAGPLAGPRASWLGVPSTFSVGAGLKLTLDIDFTTAGALASSPGTIASGTGTLALSGNNTGLTTLIWNSGSLHLNSAGSAGNGAIALTQLATGTIDNSSGSGVVLTATGNWSWGADFTWGGTNDLTRPSSVSYSTARTVTFTTGGTATLKIASGQATVSSVALNVGGGATGTKSRLHIEGASVSIATTSSVTAGYLKIGNAASLGAVGTVTAWAVSSGAAIELDNGITVPVNKNGTFIGSGPNSNDGALRSVSGSNTWSGAIQFTNVAGGRIKVDAASLTLSAATYTGIGGTSSCPVYFDAGASAILNQDRILNPDVGIVYCGNNGSSSGRVALSKANLHTGVLNCESGTTALTNANAAGPAATGAGVNVKTTARLAVEVPTTYKATFPGTTALGVGATNYASRAKFRIGAS